MADENTQNQADSAEAAPKPGSPEYDQAMAAKYDEANGIVEKQPDVPEWVPEKFRNNPEEFAKAYAELERKLSSQAQGQEAEQEGDQSEVETPETSDEVTGEEAREIAQGAGLDYDALEAEFLEKGELSEESWAKIEAANIGRETVEKFIEGRQAYAAQQRSKLLSEVGIENDTYDSMVEWAAKNLPQEQIAQMNAAFGQGEYLAKLALQDLKGLYENSQGSEPNLVTGDTVPSTGNRYEDISQLNADMSDPRYKTSEAFRQQVAQKLARSNIL